MRDLMKTALFAAVGLFALPAMAVPTATQLACGGVFGQGGCAPYGQVALTGEVHGADLTLDGLPSPGRLYEYNNDVLDHSLTGPNGSARGIVNLASGKLKTYALTVDDGDSGVEGFAGTRLAIERVTRAAAIGTDVFTLHAPGLLGNIAIRASMTANGTGFFGSFDNRFDNPATQERTIRDGFGSALLGIRAFAGLPGDSSAFDIRGFRANPDIGDGVPVVPVATLFTIELSTFMDLLIPLNTPFELSYSLVTAMGESGVFDFMHTANLGFVLPEGVTITSMGGFNSAVTGSTDPNAVPEPITLSLLGAGLAGIALARRRARG